MLGRSVLFAIWAAIGFALSLEFLYAFTPLGLAGMVLLVAVIWQLDRRGFAAAPELWGLAAGPGLFCLLVAANAEEPAGWWVACGCLFAIALAGFALSGRVRYTGGHEAS